MSHCVGYFEDSLFTEKRFDFIACDNVAFFERLDGKVLAGVSVLGQNNFSEMSPTENAEQSEAVNVHSHGLRLTSRLVSTIAILQTSRHILTLLTIIHVLLKLLLIDMMRWRDVRWNCMVLRLRL